jgi:hypothetical protein
MREGDQNQGHPVQRVGRSASGIKGPAAFVVGERTLPAGSIDGVIFGLRTPPSVESTIREWVKGRRPALELLRVQHKPNSFELTIVPA